jgi:hypothetical protein
VPDHPRDRVDALGDEAQRVAERDDDHEQADDAERLEEREDHRCDLGKARYSTAFAVVGCLVSETIAMLTNSAATRKSSRPMAAATVVSSRFTIASA